MEDISVFTFVLKPTEAELKIIENMEQAFLDFYSDSEDFYVNLPLWYHNIYLNFQGFRARSF